MKYSTSRLHTPGDQITYGMHVLDSAAHSPFLAASRHVSQSACGVPGTEHIGQALSKHLINSVNAS